MFRPLLKSAGLALLLAVAGCATGTQGGSRAPAFVATDANGRTVSLSSFRDQVLILDFWAVW